MAICPKCGNELKAGATRCWSPECQAAAPRFADSDWQHLTDRAVAVNHYLRQKDLDVQLFTVLPPVPNSQLTEFRDQTGFRLPVDFQRLVRVYSGGWQFAWSLYADEEGRDIGPADRVGNQGGNFEVPFIGATEDRTLLKIYEEFQEFAREMIDLHPDTEAVLPSLFPLLTQEEGGADYTVLRLDRDPAQVVYLDHESDYSVADDEVIADGFAVFLRKWANLGFPSCQFLRGGRLDAAQAKTEAWWKWLEDASAR